MVKDSSAIQEMWVRSLGWEDSPEEGTAIHSSILENRTERDHFVPSSLSRFNYLISAMHSKGYLFDFIQKSHVCVVESRYLGQQAHHT